MHIIGYTFRMQLVITLLFLTLVPFANLGHAATTQPSPDFKDQESQDEHIEIDRSKILTTSPTESPPVPLSARRRAGPYFYRYRHDFSIGSAVIWGKNKEGLVDPHYIGALQHQLADSKLRAYVLSGEILSDENGLLSFSRRWNHSRSRLRPYHTIGLSLLIDPEDQMATVLYLQHYLLRLGVGVEYSIGGSFSLRVDGIGLIGTKSQQGGVGLATVWGF